MNLNIKALILLIMTSVGMFSSVAQANDVQNGKKLYKNCALCHGDRGQGNNSLNAPKIAGQQAWYVERQLNNFIKGIRGGDPKDTYGLQMRPMAMALSTEKDIADVSAYIAAMEAANKGGSK